MLFKSVLAPCTQMTTVHGTLRSQILGTLCYSGLAMEKPGHHRRLFLAVLAVRSVMIERTKDTSQRGEKEKRRRKIKIKITVFYSMLENMTILPPKFFPSRIITNRLKTGEIACSQKMGLVHQAQHASLLTCSTESTVERWSLGCMQVQM
jgi:hypothetical protein